MRPLSRPTLTLGTTLKIVLFGGVIIFFAAYILYQARLLITGPVVYLTNNPEQVQHERRILLEGVAQNITEITINGRPIVTTQRGDFKEYVTLENGYTTIRIDAEDRYGRTTSVERVFVYNPQENLSE